MQIKHRYFLPVSVKVYGICLLMLSFLLLVAGGNYLRMTQIKQEVDDVAEFITPMAKNIRQTYLHALEQEILVERLLRQKSTVSHSPQPSLSESTQIPHTQWQQLNSLNSQVDQLLNDTMGLAELAISSSDIRSDIVAFARFSSELQLLQEDHQRLQQFNRMVIAKLQTQSPLVDELLLQQLQSHEAVFNQRTEHLQNWLNQFTLDSVSEIQHHDQSLLWFNALLTSMALLTGILIAWFTSKKVTRPLKLLLQGGELMQQEQYRTTLNINSRDEIGELTESFNHLMQEVAKKEKLRASFQDYIDPRIVELLSEQPEQLTGMRHQGSVLFSDLAKFSALSETLAPEALVAVVNEHYNLSGNAILQIGGLVDKYIGDAIVAYWSPPFVDASSHARLACRAALQQLQQIQQLRLSLPDLVGIRKGLPHIDIRIGVATGDIIAGNIGTEKSRTFSILGAPLSLAEALEQANKTYGTHILVTEQTRHSAGNEFVFRFAGALQQHQQSTINLFELCGYREDFSKATLADFAELESQIHRWHQGSAKLTSEKFQAYLEQYLVRFPRDNLAQHYLEISSKKRTVDK